MSDYINLFVLSNCILHFPIKIVIGFLPATKKQLLILSTEDCHYLKYAKITYVSNLNLIAARQESHRLREQVDSTITESANSMWRSWNESNDALRTRIAESTEAHTRLQYHLSRTKQEIYDQEKHIWALKRAIRDKEAPLKVILDRLYQIGFISFYNSAS